MAEEYREDDGMDPGLGEMAYDGTEYEMDEFGERIGSEGDELYDDTAMEDEVPAADEAVAEVTPADKSVEDGFGETINPETNPHLEEQLEDKKLSEEAHADYPAADDMPESQAEEDRPLA